MKLSRLVRYAILVLLAVTMGVVVGSVLGHLREIGRAERHTDEAEEEQQDYMDTMDIRKREIDRGMPY